MVALVLSTLTYLVTNFSPEALAAKRAQMTQTALADASDALLGYAMQYREQQSSLAPPNREAMYGLLPLPDYGESINLNSNLAYQPCITEGCAKINPANVTSNPGRLPWLTLGTGLLRDGHAECLWYAVADSHRAVGSSSVPMNWDTLASPDLVIGSGKPNLSTVDLHDKPLAVIFSAGPPFNGGRTANADAPLCGGNYTAANYVDPTLINHTQPAITLTSRQLFDAVRDNENFRTDINALLDRVGQCLRDEIAAGGSTGFFGKVSGADTNPCYGKDVDPRGYYPNYKEMIFLATPGSGTSVNSEPNCVGALVFAGQRDNASLRCPGNDPNNPPANLQKRTNSTDKADACNYLEGTNLVSFASSGNSFAGASRFESATQQAAHQDIVRCIPAGASLSPPNNDINNDGTADFAQLATYNPATRTASLGSSSTDTTAAGAAKLFGCLWTPEAHAAGSGLRSYFRFRVRKRGEGFSFAVIDNEKNATDAFTAPQVCGAAGQHLGYSGNNLLTPPIAAPKLAIEFDLTRNANFAETGSSFTNGRNDPCYQSSCGSSQNLQSNAHVAPVFWGYATNHAANPSVTQPLNDDNVHGHPGPTSPPLRSPPPNPAAITPYPSTAPTPAWEIAPLDRMGGTDPAKREFHVRVELVRTAQPAVDAANSATQLDLKVWVEPHPAVAVNAIAWQAGSPPQIILTAPSHGFANGDSVILKDMLPAVYNGEYTITLINANSFRVTLPAGLTYPGPYLRRINWASNVAVVTATGHGLSSGDVISISGAFPYEYNVSNKVITHINANSFSFPLPLASDPGNLESGIAAAKAIPPRAQALASVTRPMAALDSAALPLIAYTTSLLHEQVAACTAGACPPKQQCGLDNMCYRENFLQLNLGFTMGERQSTATNARNQLIDITDLFTTWLP